jgi:ABC-type multidrug transport system fused ATPase/permease subunit
MFVIAVSGAAIYAVCTVASSFAVSYMVDEVIIPRFGGESSTSSTYLIGASLVIGIGLLRAVGVVVRRSFAGVTQWWTVKTLAMQVVRKISSQPGLWHRSRMTGDVIARAGLDAEAATAVLAPLPFGTSVVVLLVISGAWLLVTDAVLGLVALVVIPLLVLMNVGYHRLVERHYTDAQSHLGSFSEAVYESLEGVSVVKAFGAEDRETARLSEISSQLRDARSKAVRIRANFEGLLDAVPSLVNVLLLVVGAYRVRSGFLSIGELSGFIYLFTLLVFPLRIIGYVLSEIPHSLSGWHRLRSILDEPSGVDPRSIKRLVAMPGALDLRGVSFAYPSGGPLATTLVVCDLELRVPQGSIVAIVGATGSGKSTLLRLAAGNLLPTSGSVGDNGGGVAVVFQDAFLFSGSVRDNVAMGDPNIQDPAVWDALGVACLDDFIRELPEGLDTEIGERGVSLSGGQRQRLALARAVARDATMLIVDDATSALDPATELQVLERLAAHVPRRTILLAASRPSAVAMADQVVFLEEGRIRDIGSPNEVFNRNDQYRALIESYATDRTKMGSADG